MSFAHVESLDALKQLRTALWKFTESANQSLSEADSDLQRTLNWLEHEARAHWQAQIARRNSDLAKAKEALRAKKMFRRSDGSRPSAVEEEKAVNSAQRRVQEAEEKLQKVQQFARILQHEALQYRGLIQRFVTAVQIEVPAAAGHLDGLIASLTGYTAPEEAGSAPGEVSATSQAAASMARRDGGSEDEASSKTSKSPADPGQPDAGN